MTEKTKEQQKELDKDNAYSLTAPKMIMKPSKTVIMYSASKLRSPIASIHNETQAYQQPPERFEYTRPVNVARGQALPGEYTFDEEAESIDDDGDDDDLDPHPHRRQHVHNRHGQRVRDPQAWYRHPLPAR